MNKKELKKILIVEDEIPVAKVLSLKLKNSGYEATWAKDGKEAIEWLKKEVFQLILLDLIMPEIDGFQVLEERKNTKNKTTPVIITSNLGQEEDEKKAKALGAKEYIIKSEITLTDMIKKIGEFFSKK